MNPFTESAVEEALLHVNITPELRDAFWLALETDPESIQNREQQRVQRGVVNEMVLKLEEARQNLKKMLAADEAVFVRVLLQTTKEYLARKKTP